MWLDIQAPEDTDSLYLDVVWLNKTATRLPEVSCALPRPLQGQAPSSNPFLHPLLPCMCPFLETAGPSGPCGDSHTPSYLS